MCSQIGTGRDGHGEKSRPQPLKHPKNWEKLTITFLFSRTLQQRKMSHLRLERHMLFNLMNPHVLVY